MRCRLDWTIRAPGDSWEARRGPYRLSVRPAADPEGGAVVVGDGGPRWDVVVRHDDGDGAIAATVAAAQENVLVEAEEAMQRDLRARIGELTQLLLPEEPLPF
jgi:hypothetical protein